MRVRHIKITKWRHFENIELTLEPEAKLVCVVGANGTGKSHLLELVTACAHRLGLAPGMEIPRGDPFADPHEFSVQMYIAPGVSDAVEAVLREPDYSSWDRTLTLTSKKSPETGHVLTIHAGGLAEQHLFESGARLLVTALQRSSDVHFLSLDADRAYPKKHVNHNELAQAYEIDWDTVEYTRNRSYRPSNTLYDEWMKYFLAQENQSGTRHITGIRRARDARIAEPIFSDPFEPYKRSLQAVLPHVVFAGVDSRTRSLLFDTTGLELSFNQLSGGEREIAFLVGQIERFRLREGLFLLDEPELHLNADLIRTWVAYLTSTVKNGQIWLATHSLEAVEAAGQQSTFILERNETTKRVDRIARLDSRPILSALSRAVGTPAFSLTSLRFVFVEGEEGVGERERFRKLSGSSSVSDLRFMECGSCNEVIRRVDAIRSLSNEAEGGLRIGGVVDRDQRTEAQADKIQSEQRVFVLPVHEVENYFLHPATLAVIAAQNGRTEVVAEEHIREAADQRAGNWIFQYAFATPTAAALPEITTAAKSRAKGLEWQAIEADPDASVTSIIDVSGYEPDQKARLKAVLQAAIGAYRRRRAEPDFWKYCEGKQVVSGVAQGLGFAGPGPLMQTVFAAWERDSGLLPRELRAFREYLAGL
jgi:energy-coupling factor transporter ATP-binding protein EcfA2